MSPPTAAPPRVEKPALPESREAVPTPLRKAFICRDDNCLLRKVNIAKPWEAAVGTVMKTWTSIAEELTEDDNFGIMKDGAACKTRFDKLMRAFAAGNEASLRSSGIEEEYDERSQLLEDISQRITDYKELKVHEKKAEVDKKEGIEKSGLHLRQCAMDEMDSDAEEDVATSSNGATVAPGSLCTRPTKRSRTDLILDIVNSSMKDIAQEENATSAVLSFMKEQMKHEDERDARRMRREEERELRQQERDQARDDQMQQFMLNVLRMMQK